MTRSYWMPEPLRDPWAKYLALHGAKSSAVICELIEERLITAGMLDPQPEPKEEIQP